MTYSVFTHKNVDIILLAVMYSKQRVAQDLRNASLSDNKPAWMRSGADSQSNKRSVGEISAKIKLGRRKMQLSLDLTRKEGEFYPRLELLAEQLQLDDFEKFVLVYLAGSMISPIFKSAVFGEGMFKMRCCLCSRCCEADQIRRYLWRQDNKSR